MTDNLSIISRAKLAELTGLSDATIWRMRNRGELPEPIQLSPGRVGWRASVIDDWLSSRQRGIGDDRGTH